MHLAWGADELAFRDELEAFLNEHAPPEALRGFDFAAHGDDDDGAIPDWAREWQATLFDHGWMIPAYPPEHGGRSCTPVQTLVYLEHMASRRIPRSAHFPGYAIVSPSLLEFGSDEQRELVPAAIRGDTIWCIGMSEPGAGSDLAGLQTRAVLDGDRFIINGQKVWTSYADQSQKCFVYTRTDPDAPKHKGISLLIVDMDTPGIDVRPLRHITGAAHFAEVFFDDVEIPADRLVGGLNDGWRITQGSLAHERAGLWVEGVCRLEATIQGLVDIATRRGLLDDVGVRRKLAEAYERAASLRALGHKGFASFAQGSSAPEHSYMKMATSELGNEMYVLAMQMLGPYAPVTDAAAPDDDTRWVHQFLVALANTIAGGSSEIQRNIIAQRVLGLPRS